MGLPTPRPIKLFIQEKYRGSSILRTADSNTRVYVDNDSGNLNVKNVGQGFLMYYSILHARWDLGRPFSAFCR